MIHRDVSRNVTNKAFSRVKIDAQLRDQGWAVENPNAIHYEYVLNDRHGRAMALLEAKRSSITLADARGKARGGRENGIITYGVVTAPFGILRTYDRGPFIDLAPGQRETKWTEIKNPHYSSVGNGAFLDSHIATSTLLAEFDALSQGVATARMKE